VASSDGGVNSLLAAVDANGHPIVVGDFSGTLDLGGSTLMAPTGKMAPFIAKLDCNGTVSWSKAHPADALQEHSFKAIAVDPTGAIYLTGTFKGTLDLGGGALASPNGTATFVAKLDASGQGVWSKRFVSAYADSIAVDPIGNVSLSGFADASADLGSGPVGGIGGQAFALRLDASGQYVWSKTLGMISSTAIALDPQGDILYCHGGSPNTGAVDFGGGPLPAAGLYLAKLGGDGHHVWSKAVGGSFSSTICQSLVADTAGNMALGAVLFGPGTVDFGSGSKSIGKADFLIAKFTGNGDTVFATLPGAAPDPPSYAPRVAVDASGNVIAAGAFVTGTLDFGGGPVTNAKAGAYDVFAAKLGPTGTVAWAKAYGDSDGQIARAIAVDPAGAPVIVGDYAGNIDFGQGALPTAPMAYYNASFVARLAP
jgi:hypothetical protein